MANDVARACHGDRDSPQQSGQLIGAKLELAFTPERIRVNSPFQAGLVA